MSTWAYSAINAQGLESEGEIEAPDVNSAREQLRNRGLMPSALRQIGGVFHGQRRRDLRQRKAVAFQAADEQHVAQLGRAVVAVARLPAGAVRRHV
jgi:type II secretory pathway component PulF